MFGLVINIFRAKYWNQLTSDLRQSPLELWQGNEQSILSKNKTKVKIKSSCQSQPPAIYILYWSYSIECKSTLESCSSSRPVLSYIVYFYCYLLRSQNCTVFCIIYLLSKQMVSSWKQKTINFHINQHCNSQDRSTGPTLLVTVPCLD